MTRSSEGDGATRRSKGQRAGVLATRRVRPMGPACANGRSCGTLQHAPGPGSTSGSSALELDRARHLAYIDEQDLLLPQIYFGAQAPRLPARTGMLLASGPWTQPLRGPASLSEQPSRTTVR